MFNISLISRHERKKSEELFLLGHQDSQQHRLFDHPGKLVSLKKRWDLCRAATGLNYRALSCLGFLTLGSDLWQVLIKVGLSLSGS